MSTATMRGEDVMTDFQFRALMKMVLTILDNSSIEDAKKTIKELAEGKTGGKGTTDSDE